MNDVKRKIERAAFGKAFDVAYARIKKNRHKAINDIFAIINRYMSKNGVGADLTRLGKLLDDENSSVYRYVCRVIDSTDKNVLKTFVLNFFFEAMYCGTKTMCKAVKNTVATYHG